MTTAIDERIKTLFEQEGLSPEVIATEERLSPVAVKAKLMQISTVYRKACNAEPLETEDGLNFTNGELREANELILETMRCAETPDGCIDWKLRSNMATYVRDDKKGRKELKAAMVNNRFNILSINEDIQRASARAKGIKELVDV